MVKLQTIPQGIAQVIEVYGNPDVDWDMNPDADWLKKQTALFDLSGSRLTKSWGDRGLVRRILAHRLVGAAIVDAESEIARIEGDASPNIDLLPWRVYGGCYSFRYSRGAQSLSTHAWGIAIDRNPDLGPLNYGLWKIAPEEYTAECRQPRHIIDAYRKRGFVNLPWDRMHFQACIVPVPLQLGTPHRYEYEKEIHATLEAWGAS